MKVFIKDVLSKCNQIRSFLWIWSHLLKNSLMRNFNFCAAALESSNISTEFRSNVPIYFYTFQYPAANLEAMNEGYIGTQFVNSCFYNFLLGDAIVIYVF